MWKKKIQIVPLSEFLQSIPTFLQITQLTNHSKMNALKDKINISIIQLAGSKPDKLANLKRAEELISKAISKYPKTKVVVLPECLNAPYSVKLFRK